METLEIFGGGLWAPTEGHLWANGGNTALPATKNKREAAQFVKRYNNGEFYCVVCKEWYVKPAEPAAPFRRFAGLYCSPCAETYKAANSRRCRLCGQPIWDCYC